MITIAGLPFRERPLLELLNLDVYRDAPVHDFAGYGWARAESLWLVAGDAAHEVTDALVLALHTGDDAEPLPDDIDLEFELPDHAPVAVLASLFLDRWLPRLPRDVAAIVLALCNPHGATLRWPAASPAPIHYARGDVTSWYAHDRAEVQLAAAAWATLAP